MRWGNRLISGLRKPLDLVLIWEGAFIKCLVPQLARIEKACTCAFLTRAEVKTNAPTLKISCYFSPTTMILS